MIIITIINFFKWVFSECTEVITTSLIPLETILPEERGFITGFITECGSTLYAGIADPPSVPKAPDSPEFLPLYLSRNEYTKIS